MNRAIVCVICCLGLSASGCDGLVDGSPGIAGTGGTASASSASMATGGAAAQTGGQGNNTGGTTSSPAPDAGPCVCHFHESSPSATAVYVGPCEGDDLYDESAITGTPGVPLICSPPEHVVDAGVRP